MSAPLPVSPAGLALALLCPALPAQAPSAYNKLEFHNRLLSSKELLFPNYLGSAGNIEGDGLFKVVPPEVLERSGDHLISGYRLGLAVDQAYTGILPAPIRVPRLQLYYTKVVTLPATGTGGKPYEVPDLERKVGPQFDPLILRLATKGAWFVEVEFDASQSNSKLRKLLTVPGKVKGQTQGLAMMFLGFPGETRSSSFPSVVLRPSFNEKHWLPAARESYSGSYNAGTKVIAMHGMTGQPSATGEVFGTLRFENPTLNLFGASAGGGTSPEETRMGPGAYANELGSRRLPGDFGLFVQAQQYHAASPTHTAIPLVVATSKVGPNQDLPLSVSSSAAVLRINPNELELFDLFLSAGLFGKLGLVKAKGPAGFAADQVGAWSSPRIPVTPDPTLVGRHFWIQAAILDANMKVVDVTNAVRMAVQ